MPRGGPVTAAVVGRTQMRAALEHFARNFDVRLAGIVALRVRPAPRVLWNAARRGCIGFVFVRPPVACPFPDIADHVVKAIAIGRKRRHWRRTLVTVLLEVLIGKSALPDIGHMPV